MRRVHDVERGAKTYIRDPSDDPRIADSTLAAIFLERPPSLPSWPLHLVSLYLPWSLWLVRARQAAATRTPCPPYVIPSSSIPSLPIPCSLRSIVVFADIYGIDVLAEPSIVRVYTGISRTLRNTARAGRHKSILDVFMQKRRVAMAHIPALAQARLSLISSCLELWMQAQERTADVRDRRVLSGRAVTIFRRTVSPATIM